MNTTNRLDPIGKRCHSLACNDQEPHDHGPACGRLCACEKGMQRAPLVQSDRERIARNGSMAIRGFAVTSDSNGPFRLVMRVPGIEGLVKIDTREWSVDWAESETAAVPDEIKADSQVSNGGLTHLVGHGDPMPYAGASNLLAPLMAQALTNAADAATVLLFGNEQQRQQVSAWMESNRQQGMRQ